MNKKQLLALIAKKNKAKESLRTKIEACEVVAELRTMQTEWNELNDEIRELQAMADAIPDEDGNQRGQQQEGTEQRGISNPPAQAQGGFNPIGTYGVGQAARTEERGVTDPYDTLEYRQAFMDFARTGRVTEALRAPGQPELRGDAMTGVADVSAVIPSTILNEIISKIEVRGQIYARVRKMSIRGGVTVPILTLKPVATWIGETPTSEEKKVQANTKVTFSYYGLECKVSTSLLADTVTLPGFESVIADLVVEAMLLALEQGIINADGDGKFLGITKDTRVPNEQKVNLSPDEFDDWSAWKKKVFAKMPLAYKAGATFIMASGTFEGYIDGMTDANGQPVGRMNYGITDGPQERFGGREVILVEDDIVANYDDASTGDVVAIYCNLSEYAINSNMQMHIYRYFDHDTNEWIDKAILIADGKLLDPNGVVIVKKGA